MGDETNKKIRSIIGAVARLGWVQRDPSEGSEDLYMHLADVEKVITAILEPEYEKRIDSWVAEARAKGTDLGDLPVLKIRGLNNLQKAVEAQRTLLAPLIKGERCIYKRCPFFKQDVPEV